MKEIPDNIKRQMIEDAKDYASLTTSSITGVIVTLNDPELYKAYREGQENGYQYATDEGMSVLTVMNALRIVRQDGLDMALACYPELRPVILQVSELLNKVQELERSVATTAQSTNQPPTK
jgi:hypothetical protein